MSSTLATPVVAPASPALPEGIDADILAAVHQDAAAEHSAVSRAKLKHSAALIDSVCHMRRICASDMKACFDHPDRPGSTMVQRRQETWEAIGRYLCILLGLAGMQIKVRALDYAGHYEVVLEGKDPVDGLREVTKTAKRHGVFGASEVERMYADKHRGGMVHRTYHNDAPAANDACASDLPAPGDLSRVSPSHGSVTEGSSRSISRNREIEVAQINFTVPGHLRGQAISLRTLSLVN